MSQETQSNPVEYFHAMILDNYHVWRKKKGISFSLTFVDGAEFSEFIAESKRKLYEKFPELKPRNRQKIIE